MLKYAYEYGIKLAFGEEGLSPEQMGAAQQLWGIGGGLAGAGLGGVGGRALAKRLADAYGWDEDKSKAIGTSLGALAGGGLGGYAGSLLPKLQFNRKQDEAATPDVMPPMMDESAALGWLPEADLGYYGY